MLLIKHSALGGLENSNDLTNGDSFERPIFWILDDKNGAVHEHMLTHDQNGKSPKIEES